MTTDKLLENIKEQHKLSQIFSSRPSFTVEEYCRLKDLNHELSNQDVVGFLLKLIDEAAKGDEK